MQLCEDIKCFLEKMAKIITFVGVMLFQRSILGDHLQLPICPCSEEHQSAVSASGNTYLSPIFFLLS
jgi:hypothetical protein